MFDVSKPRLLDRWGLWALVGVGVGVLSVMTAKNLREDQKSEEVAEKVCSEALMELERRVSTIQNA